MLENTVVTPSPQAAPISAAPPVSSVPPVAPVSPAPAYIPPKPKFSLLPLIFGFLVVVILAAVIGVVYYKSKLASSTLPSSTPSPSAIVSTPTPSPDSSSSPKATPKSTPRPSAKSTSVGTSPTPTPVALPILDIRFNNPSGNIKQTIDEGKGEGRVINREYTSIQAGQFDEVRSNWSSRVTACFHVVVNETIEGKKLKFTMTLDDKTEVEDNLGTYDKLEAGKVYDWCHDVTTSIGKHTARLTLNGDKSLKESNYNNDLARIDWENIQDRIAPNFTIGGPFDWGDKGTCIITYSPDDNVSLLSELKIEQQVDSASWAPLVDGQYCFKGVSGSSHTYSLKITDLRGNVNEQKKTFNLF